MRRLLIFLLLLPPAFAAAEGTYVPKFAREHTRAEVLDFSACTKPDYPKSSLRNEETGTVTLRFLVAPTGRIVDARVERSSGFRDLDRAALNSISQCLFRPASIDNKPVQEPAFMQYVWTLD
ncbi:MAG: energy transducer TonB [Massilia sp.]|nr:energy transducer TonB [Massilia sp.]